MPITKEQALELADKWLLAIEEKVVLKDNITISRNHEGWSIVAKTTPIIAGRQTEIMQFSIDVDTGEVGACITVPCILREINEKEGLDKQKKEQLEAKVREVEKEIKKEPIDKKKMDDLRTWFKNNASWLTDIISIISTILSKLP